MSKARERRKQMLRNRLEPVVKNVLREPYDTSTAKSGLVHFLDKDDNRIVAVAVEVVEGDIVLNVQSNRTVHIAPQRFDLPENAT